MNCPHCDYTNETRASLNNHIRMKHREPANPIQCSECDFQTPAGLNASASIRAHKRNTHDGWAEEKRIKPQFVAICEATGSFDIALAFADRHIIWNRPSFDTLRSWALEAERRDEEGRPVVTQRQVDRMENKMRRAEEWDTRLTLGTYRSASKKLSTEVADTGTTSKPQLMQYAGMNVAYGTKETAIAYPQPKTTRRRSGGGMKALGAKPKEIAAPVVEGVFRIVPKDEDVKVAASDD